MAITPPFTVRTPPDLVAAVDRLAQSAGSRSAATNECLSCWTSLVTQAQRSNAAMFDRREWNLLADACNGIAPMSDDDILAGWAQRVALELHDAQRLNSLGSKWFPDTWSGKKIAARVAEMVQQITLLDTIHGYALMDTLRLFWSEAGVRLIDHSADDWWTVEFRDELARRVEAE